MSATAPRGEQIRIRGRVQGVGFRPTVFRVALEHGVRGEVLNDGEGVLINAWAEAAVLDAFVQALAKECPPLASIETIDRRESVNPPPESFEIVKSEQSAARTGVVPDAAACLACVAETLDPFNRRYRYPFTNCTHCGPRFSIISGIPYDRAATSMAAFELCADCRREYEDPRDRRFHAQPNACHACGPKARLVRADGCVLCVESLSQLDAVDAAATLIARGEIVAIKGLGGFHLACDATRADCVAELRRRKGRYDKPFALMAPSLAAVRRYAALSELEERLLTSPAAPIVLLERGGTHTLPEEIAPGQRTLGFFLPYTPLHHLVLRRLERPIVLTSGNCSDEPQCIDNGDAAARLAEISPYVLEHDRDIVERVDDSVVRVMGGEARLLRRARGYAPASLALPRGLEHARPAIALGGELKSTFCLVKDGQAILSQHLGDLENAPTFTDYLYNIERYAKLFQHAPERVVVDQHPDYLSTKVGVEWAARESLALRRVQHHHAHAAACLADNDWPLAAGPVLAVVLDGLGYGAEGELWGGEFLRADYRGYERLGTFKPVAMLGGVQAMREPWRNTYAHIVAEMGWPEFKSSFGELDLCSFLETKPLSAIDRILRRGEHAPLASSCGRLFDAVAAAIGVCREAVSYEGQAACELEALIDPRAYREADDTLAYPFALPRLFGKGLPYVEPLSMWRALLGDLVLRTAPEVMALRFHRGLARAIVQMVKKLAQRDHTGFETIALSGGVFQNKTLLEDVVERLERAEFRVLTQRRIPPNDAGLALGQAVVDAAAQCGESA